MAQSVMGWCLMAGRCAAVLGNGATVGAAAACGVQVLYRCYAWLHSSAELSLSAHLILSKSIRHNSCCVATLELIHTCLQLGCWPPLLQQYRYCCGTQKHHANAQLLKDSICHPRCYAGDVCEVLKAEARKEGSPAAARTGRGRCGSCRAEGGNRKDVTMTATVLEFVST
jgi:hypothetical protein